MSVKVNLVKNIQIQGTNDSSIVSKLSAANSGYFCDEFLKYFVQKPLRRSAIINRGYYIRFKAVESALQAWCFETASTGHKNTQIISLGAGFDTTYFRFSSSNKLPPACKYIEIDFPEVSKKKLQCLQRWPLFTSLFSHDLNVRPKTDPSILLQSPNYVLLGLDLKDLPTLESVFSLIQVNYFLPTLLLSECAVTYMDKRNSSELIQWTQKMFPNSAFAIYEQVHPGDGFGIVMNNHFGTIGSPLKSIHSYPDEEAQKDRFFKLGWPQCSVVNIFDYFTNLPFEEKRRMQSLELFDEYEMWHEKCHHYVLIWASQGVTLIPSMFQVKDSYAAEKKIQIKRMKCNHQKFDTSCHRYGHQSVLLSTKCILLFGGFGHMNKKHDRISGLTFIHKDKGDIISSYAADPQNLLGKRMFHTMTVLKDGTIVILGGRASPSKVFSDVIILNHVYKYSPDSKISSIIQGEKATEIPFISCDCGQKNAIHLEKKGDIPMPTWRHSASLVECDGIEKIVVFGGCTVDRKATDACHILNIHSWSWSKILAQSESPTARHSHSSVTYNENVIITGGLSEEEIILNSVYIFEARKSVWKSMDIAGLLPRYSHTSHLWKEKLALVGGIGILSGTPLGLAIIDLTSLQSIEVAMPAQDPEHPILLSNHSSHVIENELIAIGGGGNCFSFGTHFNRFMLSFELNF